MSVPITSEQLTDIWISHWRKVSPSLDSDIPITAYMMLCAIWYRLYNFKNVKNTLGGVLATLIKVTLLHRRFSRFLNSINGSKSRKASRIQIIQIRGLHRKRQNCYELHFRLLPPKMMTKFSENYKKTWIPVHAFWHHVEWQLHSLVLGHQWLHTAGYCSPRSIETGLKVLDYFSE